MTQAEDNSAVQGYALAALEYMEATAKANRAQQDMVNKMPATKRVLKSRGEAIICSFNNRDDKLTLRLEQDGRIKYELGRPLFDHDS